MEDKDRIIEEKQNEIEFLEDKIIHLEKEITQLKTSQKQSLSSFIIGNSNPLGLINNTTTQSQTAGTYTTLLGNFGL